MSVTLFLVVAMVTASASEHAVLFEAFRSRYKRDYHVRELGYRRSVYADNMNYINAHNARAADGEHTFTLRENQFTDMNMCGAGWAFSAIGALEGQHFRTTGELVELSEQELVDCDSIDGGCNGGTVDGAYTYAISNGIATESSYPYTGKDVSCQSGSATMARSQFTSYVDILTRHEDALRRAVAEVGPVAASIDASTTSFQFYSGGVHFAVECSSTRLNHAVLIVGYGYDSDEGQDYWIVKNSWGTSWGMGGYIHMARGRYNNCGIATDASYPVA